MSYSLEQVPCLLTKTTGTEPVLIYKRNEFPKNGQSFSLYILLNNAVTFHKLQYTESSLLYKYGQNSDFDLKIRHKISNSILISSLAVHVV